ncbi:hypothetical protein Tco_0428391 [Tanacetum coccineum]
MDYIKLLELGMKPCQHIYSTMDSREGKLTRLYSSKGTKKSRLQAHQWKLKSLLLKDEDGEEVDVHMYRSMIGSLMYLTSSRPDIMFAMCACARYQVNPKCKKQKVVANSTTEVEYVAASSCCGQATIKAKTVNEEVQLHDRKKIIITESTMRRDLQLEDAEGVDCLPNATIFEQLSLMGYEQSSGPIEHIADEAVHKERGDSLVRVATTASSLETEGNTLRSGEDRLKLKELMELCTNLERRVLDLEKTKTTQAKEIVNLKRKFRKLE